MASEKPGRRGKRVTSAEADEMLSHLLRAHKIQSDARVDRALTELSTDQPVDLKLVLKAVVRLLQRLALEVEKLQKAPILHYDIDDLAKAFDRGGKDALQKALEEFHAAQQELEKVLGEVETQLPRLRQPHAQRRMVFAALGIGAIAGAIVGILIGIV